MNKFFDFFFKNKLFHFVVTLPTFISIGYFGFMASDIFLSESKILVKSFTKPEIPSIGSLIKNNSLQQSSEYAYAVENYILSRDAISLLDKKLKIKEIYSNDTIDLINRYPRMFEDKNSETFFDYYKKYVNVYVDPISSILTVSVRTFNPNDSFKINSEIVGISEELINSINKRMQQDTIELVKVELEKAKERLKIADLELDKYRNKNDVVLPEQQVLLNMQFSNVLQEQLLESETQLEQIKMIAKDSPQIPILIKKIQDIKQKLAKNNYSNTGGKKSLAVNSTAIQKLSFERELAIKEVTIAEERLNSAINEASKKQVYLERITQPNIPDGTLEPHRIKSIFATFVVCLIFWGILVVMIAGIKEHKEVI